MNVTLEELLSTSSNPPRKVHALWILEPRGELDGSTLERAARDDAREVRVHAMRMSWASDPSWMDRFKASSWAA